ncbi:MAG: FliH/SctL family protein [bacterium]|nr:FliH/SctL family protein [bacterium]
MSNLIKSRYIQVDDHKKIIDSDTSFNLLSGNVIRVTVDEAIDVEDNSNSDVLNMQKLVAEEEELLMNKANNLIEEAKETAASILRDAEAEAMRIKELASEEGKRLGYMEGVELGQNEIKAMEEQLRIQIEENNRAFEQQALSLEPQFAGVVSKLLEHLTGVIVEEHKDVIVHLIHQAIAKVEKCKVFVVKVSKEDYELVLSKKTEIYEGLPEEYEIQFIEDREFVKNQCVIETDGTFIDCSLDVQLKNLITDLKMLASI